MTVAEPRPMSKPERPAASRVLDLRCSARPHDADGAALSQPMRCQLLAGHGRDHALMFVAVQQRRVMVWTETANPSPAAGDWRGLPWMRGFPAPAWFDSPA